MQQIFNNIQSLLAQNFGSELSLIDEDYGQLEAIETSEDTYPVTFPCLLISTPGVEWQNLSAGAQKGIVSISIRLAIDCYDDTHTGSATEQKATERMQFADNIHKKLQGYRMDGCTPLIRKRTSCYSRPHAIKIYETTYETVTINQ
jgi:hypothetical protein